MWTFNRLALVLSALLLPFYYRCEIEIEGEDVEPLYTEKGEWPNAELIEVLKPLKSIMDLKDDNVRNAVQEALTNKDTMTDLLRNIERTNQGHLLTQLRTAYDLNEDATVEEIAEKVVEYNKSFFEQLDDILPAVKSPQAAELMSEIMDKPEVQNLIKLSREILEGSAAIEKSILESENELSKEELEELFDSYLKEPIVGATNNDQFYMDMRDASIASILNSNNSDEEVKKVMEMYDDLVSKFTSSLVEAGQQVADENLDIPYGLGDLGMTREPEVDEEEQFELVTTN